MNRGHHYLVLPRLKPKYLWTIKDEVEAILGYTPVADEPDVVNDLWLIPEREDAEAAEC